MNLTGQLLIAMPSMGDPRFERSVVYLCSHGEDGAMGLIVNKPAADVTLSDLMEQLSIEGASRFGNYPVHFGGPVEGSRGFVLHTADYKSNLQTLRVSDDFAMTATLDVLEDMARGDGPERTMMMLGYSGWGPGQLENEISLNGWLTAKASKKIVFDLPDPEKWQASLKSLGIEPLMLSGSAGTA
ncbi:MAG: YqgE/AlgH family protein [Pseudomonadota bacterium]